jgi:predicted anti-sigma-YlaC factor YlaD
LPDASGRRGELSHAGNRAAVAADHYGVRCDRFRAAASARLDGEPIGMSAATLDAHLATCVDCARWVERATQLTRQLRLGQPAVPELSGTITTDIALPAGRVLRRRLWLRAALALVGIAQLAIAVPALPGDSLGMSMSLHAAHETAAWNLAIGVALLACVLRPRRATGLLPLLGTFVITLGVLCVRDLAAGAVPVSRVATHLVALAGLVLLVALDRAERALPPHRADASGERNSGRDSDSGGAHLRGVA